MCGARVTASTGTPPSVTRSVRRDALPHTQEQQHSESAGHEQQRIRFRYGRVLACGMEISGKIRVAVELPAVERISNPDHRCIRTERRAIGRERQEQAE